MKFTQEELKIAKRVIESLIADQEVEVSKFDYSEVKLDFRGSAPQEKAFEFWKDHQTRQIVFDGGKGSGATFLGLSLILMDALQNPGSMHFVARKAVQDLMTHIVYSMDEVLQYFSVPFSYYDFNPKDRFYSFANGSKIYLLDIKYVAKDPFYRRFNGMQFDHGFIDAANELEGAAVEALTSTTGRWVMDSAKILIRVYPDQGYFLNNWYLPWKRDKLSPYRKFIQALPESNTKLNPGYLDALKKTLTSAEQKRLLEGDWEAED